MNALRDELLALAMRDDDTAAQAAGSWLFDAAHLLDILVASDSTTRVQDRTIAEAARTCVQLAQILQGAASRATAT